MTLLNKSSPELKVRGRPWDHAAKRVETEVQGIGAHGSVCLRERQPFTQQPHKCKITSYDALKGSSLSTKETWRQHLGCFSWRKDVQGETWNITGQGKTPRDGKLMCKDSRSRESCPVAELNKGSGKKLEIHQGQGHLCPRGSGKSSSCLTKE